VQPTAFGTVSAVLTDFDRTLTRLFPSPALERTVSADLLEFSEAQGLQIAALSDEADPYALWTTAYRWMRAQPGPVHCEALTRQAAARRAGVVAVGVTTGTATKRQCGVG
jgi:hypothetical protein